jgi:hypothetical protein
LSFIRTKTGGTVQIEHGPPFRQYSQTLAPHFASPGSDAALFNGPLCYWQIETLMSVSIPAAQGAMNAPKLAGHGKLLW